MHLTVLIFSAMICSLNAAENELHLTLRSRSRANAIGDETLSIIEKKADWDPRRTAMIICDMWDDHWCKSAARRVAELAEPMNEVVKIARDRGVFIIHSPSSVYDPEIRLGIWWLPSKLSLNGLGEC